MKRGGTKLAVAAGLIGIAVAAIAAPVDTIVDVRVGPLLQTKWSQSDFTGGTGTDEGLVCYNYHTPNHCACGCVATAGAQLMRYHRHPAAEVVPETYACSIYDFALMDYVPTRLAVMGGRYDWDLMPQDPAAGCTAAQRKAIGRLTCDIAVACETAFYSSEGSITAGVHLPKRLVDRFQYSNAIGASFGSNLYAEPFDYTQERFKAAVIPNLDAGLPVVLSLTSKDGGHVVVCDGYGYSDGKFYIHVNLGWSGFGDGWYEPSDIDVSDYYKFDAIEAVFYNIYPTQAAGASIVSGRVLDRIGRPVAGVTVTAGRDASEVASVTTNDRGIYALIVPAGAYEIRATNRGQWGTAEVEVAECVSTAYGDYGAIQSHPTPRIGNVFGLDVVLDQGDLPDPSEVLPGEEIGEETKMMFRKYIGFSAKGLPSGIKWNKKTGLLSGVPTNPGVFAVTFSSGGAKSTETMTVRNFVDPLIPVADAYGPGTVGVIVREDLSALGADCKVSGLPSGLKFAKKDLDDRTCGRIKRGMVYGVPTKAGTFTATFTKKIGKVTHKASATFVVDALPAWAQGQFDGGSDRGQVTLKVSKAGKLSGKWVSVDGKGKIAASAFDRVRDGVFEIDDLELAITEHGVVCRKSDFPYEAFRNTWKTDRKDEAARLKKNWTPQPQTVGSGTLSFKVGSNGTVKISGVFGSYKASCSAVLIPSDAEGVYDVFVIFPKKSNKLAGFSGKLRLMRQ